MTLDEVIEARRLSADFGRIALQVFCRRTQRTGHLYALTCYPVEGYSMGRNCAEVQTPDGMLYQDLEYLEWVGRPPLQHVKVEFKRDPNWASEAIDELLAQLGFRPVSNLDLAARLHIEGRKAKAHVD